MWIGVIGFASGQMDGSKVQASRGQRFNLFIVVFVGVSNELLPQYCSGTKVDHICEAASSLPLWLPWMALVTGRVGRQILRAVPWEQSSAFRSICHLFIHCAFTILPLGGAKAPCPYSFLSQRCFSLALLHVMSLFTPRFQPKCCFFLVINFCWWCCVVLCLVSFYTCCIYQGTIVCLLRSCYIYLFISCRFSISDQYRKEGAY